jgi:hypothetical protein
VQIVDFELLAPPKAILFGFSASSFLSIAPIAVTKDLPVWVLHAYISVTLFSFVLGIVLVWLEKRLNQQRRSQIANLDADMDEIERTFDARSTPGTAGVVSVVPPLLFFLDMLTPPVV